MISNSEKYSIKRRSRARIPPIAGLVRNVLLLFAMRRLWILIGLLVALPALAQERIVLSEVIPALQGTELGLTEVGDAPAPGMSRVVSRSEVLSALRKNGVSPQGLNVPRAKRVTRTARRLESKELAELAAPALTESFSPCQVERIAQLEAVTVTDGPLSVRVEARPTVRSGNASGVLILESANHVIRVPLRVSVRCPPPLVAASSQVRIVVRIGNVVASASGQALQAGGLDDIVSVTRSTDGARIRARVVGSATVEAVDL